MTQIKLCGLKRDCDVEAAKRLKPEYVGFVFAKKSRRYVAPEQALLLRKQLPKEIKTVGVFVDEKPKEIAQLAKQQVIDLIQLHGNEEDSYIKHLRELTDKPIIKAFCIASKDDVISVERCLADYVLLDSGAGTGKVFDWHLIQAVKRPYFLAGGLSPENVSEAIRVLHPFAVDVSSGIETDGLKDEMKMAAFVAAVREEETQ